MKEFILENFLLLTQQQKELLDNAIKINKIIEAYFLGAKTSEKNNSKMPLISKFNLQGEDEMKFQGKTIHKNKKCNTWYTRYRENGKQYYISGKTQKEVLAELKLKLNYVKKEKQKYTTLLDWYNQWLELFKKDKVKESTKLVYKQCLNKIPDTILNKNIKDIKSIEILEALNMIKQSRAKQKTYELLNDLFTKAELHKICNNIMTVIEKPKHNREHGIALSEQDKKIFIEECLKTKEYIYLVALYQGLRLGEVMALTSKDINDSELVVCKSINSNGKIDSTKNSYSNRIMPLFEPTKKIIKLLDMTKVRLFTKSKAYIEKTFRRIIEKTNLNPKYTIHSLRHTFITNCQDSNIPEHIIQNWVGHHIGSKVTKQVYTHIQQESNLLNINKLNQSKFYSNSTHN